MFKPITSVLASGLLTWFLLGAQYNFDSQGNIISLAGIEQAGTFTNEVNCLEERDVILCQLPQEGQRYQYLTCCPEKGGSDGLDGCVGGFDGAGPACPVGPGDPSN